MDDANYEKWIQVAPSVRDDPRYDYAPVASETNMMMGIEVINILANVQQRYGPHFTMRVWDRAEQIARDAGRNVLEADDMKAALRELLDNGQSHGDGQCLHPDVGW